jgi:hypothetical protein
VEGGTNYGAAFRELAHVIPADFAALRAHGYRVFRPCVFFLTDGEPLDRDWWETFKATLTYNRVTGVGMKNHPAFVPFGFRDAPDTVLQKLAYPPERGRWYHIRSTDIEQVLKMILDIIQKTVVASGQSSSTGQPALVHMARRGIPWPDAFVSANTELAKVAAEAEATSFGLMATTAVAVSVSWSAGMWLGEVAWVGDSPLWHLGDNGVWRSITLATAGDDEQDFHSSGVRAMPSADGSCSWCSFRIRGGALFAMTDGVGNPLAWSAEVRAALGEWWASPPDALTFAAQVGFAKKSHVDDRTVVGIWPDRE